MARPQALNAAAFDRYLRGRYAVERWEAKAAWEAVELFESAAAADPAYPLPYVGLAQALGLLAALGAAPPLDLVPRARRALDQALELDGGLPEAHVVLGILIARHEWDWAAAERAFRRALSLAPTLAQAHSDYAIELLAPLGRFDEAHTEVRRARELDPFSPAVAVGYPSILVLQRRFEEAEREYRNLAAGAPANASVQRGLALTLMGCGQYRESLREFLALDERDPSPQTGCIVAKLLALSGEIAAARARLNGLEELARSRYIPASRLAFIHFALGEPDAGFALLERAVELRESCLKTMKTGFEWDPLRADLRFRVLQRKVGLQEEGAAPA